jgi:hypothetical protein
MKRLVNKDDLVEVLPNRVFPGLSGYRGVVLQPLSFGHAIVSLSWPTTCEEMFTNNWIIPCNYLKIHYSNYDDNIGFLEEKIESLEDELLITRSLLGYSEDMREVQSEAINKLVEEIDLLKKELYDARKI